MPKCRFCWNTTPHGDYQCYCEEKEKVISYEEADKQTKCKQFVLCQCEDKEYMDIFAEEDYKGRPYAPRHKKSVEQIKLFDTKIIGGHHAD